MKCQLRNQSAVSNQKDANSPQSLETKGIVTTVRVCSRALFARAKEIEIEHNGALYRLRQTAMGKLILTK